MSPTTEFLANTKNAAAPHCLKISVKRSVLGTRSSTIHRLGGFLTLSSIEHNGAGHACRTKRGTNPAPPGLSIVYGNDLVDPYGRNDRIRDVGRIAITLNHIACAFKGVFMSGRRIG